MDDGGGSNQPHAPSDRKKPNRIVRGVSAIKRYLEKRRSEKKQETAADRSARSTARATWAIALLTVATISVGILQYNIISAQLNEMRDEQRPWVSVEITGDPMVTIAPKKSSVALTFTLKNVGKSVALGATGKYFAQGFYGSTPYTNVDPCISDGLFSVADSRTMFPGEVYSTSRLRLLFGGWDFTRSQMPSGATKLNLIVRVLGCLRYTFDGSVESHRTPFAFDIYGSEYSPGILAGFPVEGYGEITSTVRPVSIYINGVNPN